MKFAILVVLSLCILGFVNGQKAYIPESRPDQWWQDRHALYKQNSLINHDNINLLFYGDSITEGWSGQPAIWNTEYEPYGAANYGIGGDQTQHVLWRAINGEITPLWPKLIILKIGINNIAQGESVHTDDEIILGVETIIQTFFSFIPKTKVLLLGVLPANNSGWWDRLLYINPILASMANNETVFFHDMWDDFTKTSPGYGATDPAIFPDGVHLSTAGYEIWAESMRPILEQIWNSSLKK